MSGANSLKDSLQDVNIENPAAHEGPSEGEEVIAPSGLEPLLRE